MNISINICRKFLQFLFVPFCVFVLSSQAIAQIKVGVVDMQKALQDVNRGKTAKSSLEKEFDRKKKEIEKEQADIKKMTDEFQKKAAVMSEKARQEKQIEIQTRMGNFQELVQRSQMEIQQREAELTMPIVKDLRDLVADIAKSKSLEMVFETNANGPAAMMGSSLIYAKDKVDVTTDLVQAFDKKHKK
jgi:outer membrane protein